MSAAKSNNDNENTDFLNQVNDLLFRFPLSIGQRGELVQECVRDIYGVW